MARGVDEIELVGVAVLGSLGGGLVHHADGVGLDGDAALAFEVHGVEHLRLHLAIEVSEPVSSSRRSESVDLPWSICAMIAKLRMWDGSMKGEVPQGLC